MLDPNFQDSEYLQRLHQQKMEAMKVLMNEIVENPSGVSTNDLMQVVDYLSKVPNNNEDDGRPNAPT
jgi:hypothetical protein